MRLTRLTTEKVTLLWRNAAFKKHPIRVAARILLWELRRLLNIPLVSTLEGQTRILLYPEDGIARLIYYYGVHDAELAERLDAHLRPGMCVVDAGANIGAFSLMAAQRVGPEGKVLAIEPDPATYKKLSENLQMNDATQVIAVNCALSDLESEAYLSSSVESSRRFVLPSRSEDAQATPIRLRTLDLLAMDQGLPPVDYLKIDVEGYEMHVLRGAKSVLAAPGARVVQAECLTHLLARQGNTREEVMQYLDNAGYVPVEPLTQADLVYKRRDDGVVTPACVIG